MDISLDMDNVLEAAYVTMRHLTIFWMLPTLYTTVHSFLNSSRYRLLSVLTLYDIPKDMIHFSSKIKLKITGYFISCLKA